MANFGFKASEVGEDVFTASDDKLLVTTKYSCPKVIDAAADTIPVSGGSGSLTITHELQYPPLCLVYSELVAGDNKRNLCNPVVLNGNKFGYRVNATELIIENITSGGSGTYHIFEYIFNESL